MFQNTLRKLTAFNSIVFIILFLLFGGAVVGYVSYRMYDKVDDAMRYRVTAFKIANGRVAPTARLRATFDPRIFILLKHVDGRIVNLFPIPPDELSGVNAVAATAGNQVQSIAYEGHVFRTLKGPYQYEDNLLVTEKEIIRVQEVIVVAIVDSEVELLDNLRLIVIASLLLGTSVSILAGYVLARRALVPIVAAWDKQQEFVADASHELRSPLTVIQSNAELILKHPDHTVQKESPRVTNILRETMRMTRLISTLLTLARADANQAELRLELIELNDIAAIVAEQFKPLAELKGLAMAVDIKGEVRLTADRERLHQLLVILMDNALKFTAPPGQICVTCYQQANMVNIKVKDTGCGIAQEDLPKVFNRFFRGDKARSRDTGGTGLGLSIAKWIVEKHGGKIKVTSEVGSGTQFHVLLPVNPNISRILPM